MTDRPNYGPRIPSPRELLVVTIAVVYGLVWIVAAVMALDNVRDHGQPERVTPVTAGPAVIYEEP